MKPISVTVKDQPKAKKRRAPSAVRGKRDGYTLHTPAELGQYDTIIGVDQSKSGTGWAVYVAELDGWLSGVKSFNDTEGNPHLASAFAFWAAGLIQQYGKGRVIIVFEEAHHQGGASTLILVGMAFILLGLCHEMVCDCISIHTGTLKKHMAGTGAAKKADMIKVACDIVGKAVADDNEADAICLAEMGRRIITSF